MFRIFCPNIRLSSVKELTPEYLKKRGIKALILDIDNTLVEQDAPAGEAEVRYINSLKAAGIRTAVLSNNSEERVRSFAEQLGCLYVFHAQKPSRKGYMEALRLLGCKKRNTLAVGDQLFTDIWGANRAGIVSVLVKPVNPKHEAFSVRLKRPLEWLVTKMNSK